MKKLQLFMMALLVSITSFGQNYNIDVCVDIGPIPPGMPPGDINLWYSVNGVPSSLQGTTDSTGVFCTNITVNPDSSVWAFVDISAYQMNCMFYSGDSVSMVINSDTSVVIAFPYCDSTTTNPPSGCSTFFAVTQDSVSPNTFYLNSYPTGTPPFSYLWTFSDGSTATSASVTYTPPASSAWLWACLDVIDSTGCVASYCDYITTYDSSNVIGNSCYANFYPYYDENSTPGEVMFYDFSSATGNIIEWNWDFGDGSTSSLQNPTHVYSSTNIYPICLTITTDDGCTSTYCESFYVNLNWWNQAPWNSFDSTCYAYFEVYQDSSNNFLYFIDFSIGNNLYYTWDFGNNIIINDPYPFVTLNAPGTYNVCLTVTDTISGCQSTYCDSIELNSQGVVLKTSVKVYAAVVNTVKPSSYMLTSTSDIAKNTDVYVFPNPATEFLYLNVPGNQIMTIFEIYNINGQKVQTGTFNKSTTAIDISNLPEGIYMAKVYNDKMHSVFKISKTNR